MKFLSFATVLTLTIMSSTSFARCFTFVNGNGPDRIQNIELGAKAKRLCINNVTNISGRVRSQVELSDEQGFLGLFEANVSQDRSPTITLIHAKLGSGNANGMNVNAAGIEIQIKGEKDGRLNIEKGLIQIAGSMGVQKFVYVAR